jgi:predicted cupin superfamily sugar epimerase
MIKIIRGKINSLGVFSVGGEVKDGVNSHTIPPPETILPMSRSDIGKNISFVSVKKCRGFRFNDFHKVKYENRSLYRAVIQMVKINVNLKMLFSKSFEFSRIISFLK